MGNEEKKNITIADVAEALGVSKTTVSRAISGKGRIGQETRDRVLKYIEEHDYKPNVIAKGLAQSKTYNLCVVMPGEYDVVDLTFFQECLFGIQEIAGIMEYDILLSICKNNDISSLERIISNRKVDGVILMRTFVEDRQIEYLQEKKVPFVTIGSSNYTGVIQIDHNHKSACKELTSIILMKGMKRIALIGGDENHVVTQSRLRGFREAYEKMGEVIDPTMLFLNLDNHVVIDKIVEEVLYDPKSSLEFGIQLCLWTYWLMYSCCLGNVRPMSCRYLQGHRYDPSPDLRQQRDCSAFARRFAPLIWLCIH